MAGKDDKFEELMKSAEAKIAEDDFEGAIADYTAAINLKPADKAQFAEAYNGRGEANAALGDHEEAIEDFDESIRLNHRDLTALNNRGLAEHRRGRYNEATRDFDMVIRLCDQMVDRAYGDTIAWNNRGLAKTRLGDYKGAIADFDMVIHLDPTDKKLLAAARKNRGLENYKLENFDDALKDFTEALRLSFNDPEILKSISAIKTLQKISDSAEDKVDKIKKAEEYKKQSEEYERRENANRKSAYWAMIVLAIVILALVTVLVAPDLRPAFLSELESIDLSNPFGLLPWITMTVLIISPLMWLIRLLLTAANKAELMQAEYEHLFLVERRLLVYFPKDDSNDSRRIRADCIKTTVDNSPADKLLAFQNKANVPSKNIVEKIVKQD